MNLDQIKQDIAKGEGLHREYTGGSPARLMIYRDKVVLDNPCTLHHFGEITPDNLRPFAKNPTICKFMIQLGRFDQLGSGVTNINRYLPLYAKGAKPIFNETRHGFELTIPLAADVSAQVAGEEMGEAGDQVGIKSGPSRDQVEILCKCLNGSAITELMKIAGRTNRTKFRDQVLKPLLENGMLEMTIPDKPRSSKQKYHLTAKGKQQLERGK